MIKITINRDARIFLATSIKVFSDYFINRYCRVNSATADDITIVSMDCDVVIGKDTITVDGTPLTILVWGSDNNPRYNTIDNLGDGILAYVPSSPYDVAFGKANLTKVYNILYNRSQDYRSTLPLRKVYHDCGLYSKDPDTNDDSGCVSYALDYDNFTDIDKSNYALSQKFQDKANWIANTFGLDY